MGRRWDSMMRSICGAAAEPENEFLKIEGRGPPPLTPRDARFFLAPVHRRGSTLIGFAGLAVLRCKVSNPLLFAAAASVGLIAFPLLQPTWVMIK